MNEDEWMRGKRGRGEWEDRERQGDGESGRKERFYLGYLRRNFEKGGFLFVVF